MIKHITQFEILIFIICTEIFEGGGEGGQLKKKYTTTTSQSRTQYFCTYPKRGPAQDSSNAITRDSNISARTPKKVIFLHEPLKKDFFFDDGSLRAVVKK